MNANCDLKVRLLMSISLVRPIIIYDEMLKLGDFGLARVYNPSNESKIAAMTEYVTTRFVSCVLPKVKRNVTVLL